MSAKSYTRKIHFYPKFYITLLTFCFLLFLLLVTSTKLPTVYAASNTVHFQGRIVNNTDGTNLQQGSPACITSGVDTCDFRVSIYDSVTLGNQLFVEVFDNVEIGDTDGIFDLEINSVCQATGSGTWDTDGVGSCISNGGVDFSISDLYLQVEFDDGSGYEAFTRKKLTQVPSAKYAEVAGQVSSTSNAFIQDGNSFGGAAVLGTNDANSLSLETNGLSRLSIDTDGFVEIGTGVSTPTATTVLQIEDDPTRILDDGTGILLNLTLNNDTILGDFTGQEINLINDAQNDLLQGMLVNVGNDTNGDQLASLTGQTINLFDNSASSNPIQSLGLSVNLNSVNARLSNGINQGIFISGVNGTGSTNYGIRITDVANATNNYAILTRAGDIVFNELNDANTQVGIGVTNPTGLLSIAANTSSAAQLSLLSSSGVNPTTPNDGDLWYNGTNLNFFNGSSSVDILAGASIGSSIGSGTSGSILFIDSTGSLAQDNANLFFDNTNKRLGVGGISPSYSLDVLEDFSTGYAANFFNDGNNADRYGLRIQAGADTPSGTFTTYYLDAYDGDGTQIGYIANVNGTFGLTDLSDERTKTNIANTEVDAIAVINGLRVVDYNRTTSPNGPIITGFIAQEVQKLFPGVVNESPSGILGINQTGLIPLLTKGIQDQQVNINTINEQLNMLAGKVNGTESEMLSLQTFPGTISVAEAFIEENLIVKGQIVLGNDTVGKALLLKGEEIISITFNKPYSGVPIITLTPVDFDGGYVLTEVTPTSFKIKLTDTNAASRNVTFNWTAFGDFVDVESDTWKRVVAVQQTNDLGVFAIEDAKAALKTIVTITEDRNKIDTMSAYDLARLVESIDVFTDEETIGRLIDQAIRGEAVVAVDEIPVDNSQDINENVETNTQVLLESSIEVINEEEVLEDEQQLEVTTDTSSDETQQIPEETIDSDNEEASTPEVLVDTNDDITQDNTVN